MTTKTTTTTGNVVHVEHEPGNGTRYEAVGVFIPEQAKWLIAFPLFGTAYYFNSGSYVAASYVEEKLGKTSRGHEVTLVDLHEMVKLIAKIVGGQHDAETDDTGRFRHLKIAQ